MPVGIFDQVVWLIQHLTALLLLHFITVLFEYSICGLYMISNYTIYHVDSKGSHVSEGARGVVSLA